MLFGQTALFLSSLVLLASAQEPEDAIIKGLTPGRTRLPTSTNKLMSRSLDKRCTGSCEECFGDGYTLCPDSSIYCYLPGDSYYGLDSCPGSSTTDYTSSAAASTPTSTSSSGVDDICYETGATCTSCFGPTYLECPDGYHCYDPNDPLYDTCPDDDDTDTSSSGDSSDSSSTTCADIYGAGSVPCGDDSCYNPDEGDVCCADGYHCEGGYTCSTIVGKCCAPGSTSSSCSSSDTDSGLSSSYTLTSDISSATSSSGLVYSTDALVTTSATETSSTSSSTSVSQFDSGGAGSVAVGKGLLLAAGLGALVL
ncbi:uncharacterized protein Z518_09318 [Rhinocladiella mackenziei CBS 650.93]|uniref:Rhinocladiella mackenziei CBS 650.93 unplaced genomic scaffold supercont1.7, whole genome shotgun sequence n=1 Tax=Rhinocladiella mackenziei CBS 650.93 TaxID=1442369 RepID=A0A0D2FHZ0_9EURO|nr:uncharacterized protein Z518_09318 [Rhinocladiella mackenziei CBS 650.93]KIX01592.1 hypothetical protein Z518_09318 [Rhinocladiella mackenziei CBS 650.93]